MGSRYVRGGVRLKGVKKSGRFASGNPRCYFRVEGGKNIPLPDAPMDSPEFLKAYTDAAEGKRQGPQRSARTGSLAAGIDAFIASDSFLGRAPSTRQVWRRMMRDLRSRYGELPLRGLAARHIRADLAKLPPHPANNRLKVWRALGRFWLDAGLMDTDPARDVRKRQTPATQGHTPWTDADVEAFRRHWPIGTMQRLALELLAHTGAARVDVVKLGKQNITEDGWLVYTRQKCGTICTVPMTCPAPDWFPASPYLADCIEAAQRHMIFLSTARGASRSSKAFGAWFSAAARAAGIEAGKTAHGLRKWLAVSMAERGATAEQRMAILGHETSAQTRSYSKTADAKRIISGTDFGNFRNLLPKQG